MDKTTQDHVWKHCLPKEFKEEVKKRYKSACQNSNLYSARGTMETLELLFGIHNLTSDAEEEEMLCVSRKQVQELYNKFEHAFDNVVSDNLMGYYGAKIGLLKGLFGSMCLPDELSSNFCQVEGTAANVEGVHTSASTEPKSAEPKFKVNDVVRTVFNETTHITSVLENGNYYLYGMGNEYPEDSLTLVEPYTEPTDFGKEVNFPTKKQSRNLSQNCDKQFDNILKDGFRNERRLNIATAIMSGVMANPNIIKSRDELKTISGNFLASYALEFADALLAECENTNNNKQE